MFRDRLPSAFGGAHSEGGGRAVGLASRHAEGLGAHSASLAKPHSGAPAWPGEGLVSREQWLV